MSVPIVGIASDGEDNPLRLTFETKEPLVVVLNDDETFTNLDDCKVYAVPEGFDTDQIEDALANDELVPAFVLTEERQAVAE